MGGPPPGGQAPGGPAPTAVLRSRIGWLLRVNRRYAADERWARAAAFTAAPRTCRSGWTPPPRW
jgi:hypothetical protein